MSGINVEDVLYALRTCSMDNPTKCKECAYVQEGDCYVMMMRDAEAVIRERVKEGKWEPDSSGIYLECSSCHHWSVPEVFVKDYKYCPNCGARMEQ